MKKKMMSLALAVVMCLSLCVPAFATDNINGTVQPEIRATVADENGNVISSVTRETDSDYIVEIYSGGYMSQKATTNKATKITELEMFDNQENIISEQTYDLKEHVSPVAQEDILAPMMELEPTDSFDIYGRYRTDYTYNGSILYGDTYTMAHELSSSYRYESHMIQFSAGTAVGVVLSVLIAYYGGAITIATIGEIGLPTAAGVLVDYVRTTVCFTKYRVVTKVYFNGTYTVNAGNTYDKVLVAAGTGGSMHYSTDYYGYDIINSWASYCCSSGVLAFRDKYVTGAKPNLSLPITSIPYNG